MRLVEWGVAAVVLCACASARAEVLLPLEPVSPDGFEVHADAPPSVEGGVVSSLGAGRYVVVPAPSTREVRLEVGGETHRLRVGPPATSVGVAIVPARPVKGRDVEASLDITVGDEAGAAPPVLRANVGSVTVPERVSPGRYRATYRLPATRFPEVAIIVAFSAWPHPQSVYGAVGVLRVPLATAVEVPGRTEGGAQMRMTIAGQTFGPVTAAGDGSFRLPVVVPPGYGIALGEATDRVGNRRRTSIDLRLPPTDQLACVVTPTRVPADGASKARLLCATSNRFGDIAQRARVQLTASLGTLGPPREAGPGLLEWTWTAPANRGDGTARIDARWRERGTDSSEQLSIALGQGPVASLAAASHEPIAYAGGRWKAHVRALDALGRPLDGVSAKVSAPVGSVEVSPAGGGLQLAWALPESMPPRDVTLRLRAFGPVSTEPARLWAWGDGRASFAAVTDLAGLPVAGQTLLLDGAPIVTGDDGAVAVPKLGDGAHVLQHAHWPGLQQRLVVRGGRLVYPASGGPLEVALDVPVTVAPPVPVNVRLEAAPGGARWWLETADGQLAEGREVTIVVDGRASQAVSGAPSTVAVSTGGITVQDVKSRVSALLEVQP